MYPIPNWFVWNIIKIGPGGFRSPPLPLASIAGHFYPTLSEDKHQDTQNLFKDNFKNKTVLKATTEQYTWILQQIQI